MANTIIVYYSLEGNIDSVANLLKSEIGADTCRLETVKEYPKTGLLKFFHGGKDSTLGFKPELKTPLPDLSSYDTVVIGAPVWAGKPAAPINTFIEKAVLNNKKVYTFASSAGGNAEKTLSLMQSAISAKGGNVLSSESFISPLRNTEDAASKAKEFAKKIIG